jgi:hypothetical protein
MAFQKSPGYGAPISLHKFISLQSERHRNGSLLVCFSIVNRPILLASLHFQISISLRTEKRQKFIASFAIFSF